MAANLTTADHIRVTPKENLIQIPVSDCAKAKYEGEERTNKAIKGIILLVRHSSQADFNKLVTSSMASRYATGVNGARTRAPNARRSRPYDRMITLGDLNDPSGKCFVLILKNVQESTSLFKVCSSSQEGVGDIFVFEEPASIHHTLGTTTSVNIVDSCLLCYPINGSMKDHVPQVNLVSPMIGDTRYFSKHGDTEIALPNATFARASCNGKFCDKQLQLTSGQACGCFYNPYHAFVTESDVSVNVHATFNLKGRITIGNF